MYIHHSWKRCNQTIESKLVKGEDFSQSKKWEGCTIVVAFNLFFIEIKEQKMVARSVINR